MAQLLEMFDATQIAPEQSGSSPQLPLGKHPVVIVESEVKATKAGDGGYLAFVLEVIDGPARGERGIMRLNLYSSSEKAKIRAQGQASALSHVTGIYKWQDTNLLHNKPFVVDVGTSQLTDEQKTAQLAGQSVTPFTQVNKILDMQGNEPGKAPNQQQQQPQQQQPQQNFQPPAQQQQPQQNWNQQPANQQQQPAQQTTAAPAQTWGNQQPAGQQQPAQQGWQQGNPSQPAQGAPAGGMPWGQPK